MLIETTYPAVKAEPYSWPFTGRWSVGDTALICVDFQNDFCAANGGWAEQGVRLNGVSQLIPRAASMLNMMRKQGFLVVHLRQSYRDDWLNLFAEKYALTKQKGVMIGFEGSLGKCLIQGEAGWQLMDRLEAVGDEPIVDRPAVNGFIASDLNNLLAKSGIKNLLFMGACLEGSIHATVCAANDRGFENMILMDCCGFYSQATATTVVNTTVMGNGLFGTVGYSSELFNVFRAHE